MKVYDLIIIGLGPGGITASIYAARKRMDFLVITKDIGGQTLWTQNIENYSGYQIITGNDLAKKFKQHLEEFKINIKENETVTLVKNNGNVISTTTDKGEYLSKTLIIASGRIPRKLGIEGEEKFRNKGVAYCATCDAPLFSDMNVAVIGGGNAAVDAALQLTNIAKKIYLIDVAREFVADLVMVEKVLQNPKTVVYHNTFVKKISGDDFVKGITIEREDKSEDLSVEGVFIEIGSYAASDFTKDVEKNMAGEIFINCRCETNVSGIFAAGDVTNVIAKQIIVAAGEGAKAAISAYKYLSIRSIN